jgi:hypothetical protein
MTGERTRSERLLHETVGASVLPRHLGHRHLHTHIFAYTNICVNPWWIAKRTQLGTPEPVVEAPGGTNWRSTILERGPADSAPANGEP